MGYIPAFLQCQLVFYNRGSPYKLQRFVKSSGPMLSHIANLEYGTINHCLDLSVYVVNFKNIFISLIILNTILLNVL